MSTRFLYRATAVLAAVSFLLAGAPLARAQSPGCETDIVRANDNPDPPTPDRFGWSTSVAGDYAFFGATNAAVGPDNTAVSTGSVYVFKRDGSLWNQQVELNASDAESFEFFGYSVSADGDFLLVGARKGDKTVTEKTGAAYIYKRSGESWNEEYKLFASDAAADDFFGHSASLRGDWALVGAPGNDDNASKTGSVYFYQREFDDENSVWVWIQRAKKNASDRAEDDQFGTSVATTGDWAIGGAPNDDDACTGEVPTCKSGSAYIFQRTPESTTWTETAKIVGDDTGELDRFGWSVAMDGEVAVVGAKDHDPGTGARTGAVYVFRYDGAEWVQEAKLLASDGVSEDKFGQSVAIRGNSIFVGASTAESPAEDGGAAYWFQYDGENWVETAKFTASDGRAQDWFGYSVGTDGNTATVGAYKDSDSTGAGYTFTISPGEDCNENGFPDVCDIADGIAADVNENGIPDQCECDNDTQCDDLLICTTDSCNLATARCEHVVEEGSCVAVLPTGGDWCWPHGTPNPANECQFCDALVEQEGWSPVADGIACADEGNDCTKNECAAGECSHPPEDVDTACGDDSDSDCDHADTCDGAGVCLTNVEDEGAACGDLVDTVCNPLDTCDAVGTCVEAITDSGTDCNDGLYCNGDDDLCDGLGECARSGDPCADREGLVCAEDNGGQCQCDPADDKCDDGVFCNGLETCNASTNICDAGTAPCSGSEPFCDEPNSRCVECVEDADCDDGAYCNGEESCDVANGVCLAGIDIDCDDAVGCTDDSCDEVTDSCDNAANDNNCDNGDYCDGAETCDPLNGDLLTGCLDNEAPCPGQECRESDNRCVECLAPADCDNGDFCDGTEDCDFNGDCMASTGDPCVGQNLVCNEAEDACECDPADDKCDDGSFCNGAELCNTGTLLCDVGTEPCSGATPFCDENADACVECRNSTDCDDGVYCNGTEGCIGGSCTQGSDPCPGRICDEAGQRCIDCTGNADCDDGAYCNGNESCVGGTCASGNAPCPSGFVCDEPTDSCSCDDDGDCDNGAFCDGAETCDVTGDCIDGSAPCTQDQQCDEGGNRCVECLIGADCDDSDECTLDRCPDGLCVNTPVVGCKDADLDEIKDDVDQCPNTPGGADVDENGCSCNQLDGDSDDVDDCRDLCPATPAVEADAVDMAGCSCSQLDDDEDDVDNCDDNCADTPTGHTVNANGCSESQLDDDEDGVANSVDQCDDTPTDESADFNGCSASQLEPPPPQAIDTDEDGVLDEDDDCPGTPAGEAVDAAGCSASQLDSDNDGVSDDVDQCADTPAGDNVDAVGCTVTAPPDGNGGTGTAECGACGAFGIVSWMLLVAGMLGLRTRFVRDSVKR